MKNKLTNNIGLKFAAVLFAALLWLIVVNVDDPVDTNIYRNIPVTVTTYGTSLFAAAVLFSPVIINLRTGTAGAGTMLPEIVLLTETEDPLRRNTDLLIPNLKSLIIVLVNRRIQAVRIQPYHLC